MLENSLVINHIKDPLQDVGYYAPPSGPNLYKVVHRFSCIWHEPSSYSWRHLPNPQSTLRDNPGCAVEPKTPTTLELNPSPKERAKTNHKQIKRVTRWFVLPRFGSCKPTPRWGGHKDRVSFNPFPLSNGHLDRVSFSPQSIGTLSPHKDHHNLVSLALITKVLRIRMGKKKSDPSDKNSNEHKYLSLTSH
jgi:hypothetical protein